MDEKWITIKCRKVLPLELFFALKSYVFSEDLYVSSIEFGNAYSSMSSIIAYFASVYRKGETEIPEHFESYINRCGLSMPKERRLPEALEEMFAEMEKELHFDFSAVLDRAVEESMWKYEEEERIEALKKLRMTKVLKMIEEDGIRLEKDRPPIERVYSFLTLEKVKKKNGFCLSSDEVNAVLLFCDILSASVFSDVITSSLMTRLVENDLLTEDEISDMLCEKYSIDKDYECYSEDFLGCGLDEKTVIRIDDVLDAVEERISKIIGVSL